MKVLTADDFKLASCQASIFTPDEEVSSLTFLKAVFPSWLKHFDGEPLILPRRARPKDAQPAIREIPTIVLSSSSGAWRCEIADARMNVVWSALRDQENEESISEVIGTTKRFMAEYIDSLRVRVGRMAAVINRYAQHPSPGLLLARHFCQTRWGEAPLNRPESFELHAHKRFNLGAKYVVNSWVRSRTAVIGENQEPIVSVEQDLNTLSEEASSRQFSTDDVSEFLSLAAAEFDSILALYYPREGVHA